MRTSISLVAALALFRQTCAHVVMIEPHPYNLDTPPLAQVGPLTAQFPWPCQGMSGIEEVTTVTAGTTQLVRFWGSAVHGGGSCQFSIAYGDTPPSEPTAWHTVYSMIGGCPAEAVGNIPTTETDPHGRENGPQCGNDSGTECTRQFNIPIPKQMKNGNAVFAWTWFNKIGNREMYMVCAPIKVVGGTDDQSFVDKLPPIFRANIAGQCTTGNGVLGFPDPGDYGVVHDAVTPGSNGGCEVGVEPVFQDPAGGGASQPASPSTPSPSTPGSVGTPSAVPSSVNSPAASMPVSTLITSPVASPTTTLGQQPPASDHAKCPAADTFYTAAHTKTSNADPSSKMTSGAPSSKMSPAAPSSEECSAEPPSKVTSAPLSSKPSTAVPSNQVSSAAPSSSGRPYWAVGMDPCPTSGALICFTPKKFGICNSGWALPQDVPAGTVCVNEGIAHEQVQ
ncbi:hypothetical protein BKA56DRAFT_679746 [Ilyonectria sp. MPI-CAGE-AT-0026]|nr:hypothetical protein BKA56DRAFT_679746 [Ilyonectria sp. MPI-CAGE-AT-0026]